ncbi:MAG: hypothetical protein JNL67_17815 [Planctomycetaceae bacterium]|nr:hypothetical protein [Planctomycetaceae bacterium]
MDERYFLCPAEDLWRDGSSRDRLRAKRLLGSYLLVRHWTSRLCRRGKSRVLADVVGILDRLGTNAE